MARVPEAEIERFKDAVSVERLVEASGSRSSARGRICFSRGRWACGSQLSNS